MTVQQSDTRQRILAAALELFSERGFAATTTAAIAQKAGVAEKTLFAQFKSKDLLFEQTLSPAVLELIAPGALSSVVSTVEKPWENLEDFLRAIGTNRVEFAKAHVPQLKLLVHEVLLRPQRMDRFIQRVAQDLLPGATRLVDHFVEIGELRPMPPTRLVRIMVSIFAGYVFARTIALPDADWDDATEIETMARVLADGLRPRAGAKKVEKAVTKGGTEPPPRREGGAAGGAPKKRQAMSRKRLSGSSK